MARKRIDEKILEERGGLQPPTYIGPTALRGVTADEIMQKIGNAPWPETTYLDNLIGPTVTGETVDEVMERMNKEPTYADEFIDKTKEYNDALSPQDSAATNNATRQYLDRLASEGTTADDRGNYVQDAFRQIVADAEAKEEAARRADAGKTSEQIIDELYMQAIGGTPAPAANPYNDTVARLADKYFSLNYGDYLKGDEYAALKDIYARNGRLAMQDTLGQAAARTGGIASSYATSASQQAYNDYMQRLTDKAMEGYEAQRGRIADELNMARKLQSDAAQTSVESSTSASTADPVKVETAKTDTATFNGAKSTAGTIYKNDGANAAFDYLLSLVDSGYISEEDMARILSVHLGVSVEQLQEEEDNSYNEENFNVPDDANYIGPTADGITVDEAAEAIREYLKKKNK